jgi:hypothetical protein
MRPSVALAEGAPGRGKRQERHPTTVTNRASGALHDRREEGRDEGIPRTVTVRALVLSVLAASVLSIAAAVRHRAIIALQPGSRTLVRGLARAAAQALTAAVGRPRQMVPAPGCPRTSGTAGRSRSRKSPINRGDPAPFGRRAGSRVRPPTQPVEPSRGRRPSACLTPHTREVGGSKPAAPILTMALHFRAFVVSGPHSPWVGCGLFAPAWRARCGFSASRFARG